MIIAANAAMVALLSLYPGRTPLALALLAAAPVVAYCVTSLLHRPQLGILVLAALLPLHGLLIPLALGDWANAWKEVLVGATLVATFLAPASARGTPGRPIPREALAVVLFFAFSLASAAAVGGLQAAVGLKVGFFATLIAVAVWRCPLDARERDRLVTILMVAGAATALFGIAQQFIGAERLAEFGWEYTGSIRTAGGYLRSFSTFESNFPFALFLMLVLVVGISCAMREPRRTRSQLFFLSIPLLLAGVTLSVTRAGWVGIVVGVAYLGAVRSRALLTVLVRVLIVGAALLIALSGFSAVFLSSSSSGERLDIWDRNVPLITSHPLGLGIGATGSAAEKVAELAGDASEKIVPDNAYLKTALELGVVGLWLFVLVLVSAFLAARRWSERLEGADRSLADGVAAMVLAAMAISVVATYLEVFPLDAYFWMLLGVVGACASESS